MSNVLLRNEDIRILENGEMCPPRFADLHLSNKCKMLCKGCAYSNHIDGSYMSKEDAFKVVDTLVSVGVKAFDIAGGGEPLDLPYIYDLLKHIREKNCFYGIITNGLELINNNELADFIVETATYCRISFEATSPIKFQEYKGLSPKVFDDLYRTVTNMVGFKRTMDSDCEIGLKFSVGKTLDGPQHYNDGIVLGMNLQVDNVQFKALRHEPEELTLTQKRIERQSLHDSMNRLLPTGSSFVREWIIPWKGTVPQCWLNPLHTVVDYKGDVYLCCYYYYREDSHRLGNMLTTPFTSLWYSPKHKVLIEGIDRKECDKVDCKFFRHHRTYEQAVQLGRGLFL